MRKRQSVIVSLTPTAAIDDTRTIKIARSFAKLGYRSIIVENKKSPIDLDIRPVEIISLPGNVFPLPHKNKGLVSPREGSKQSLGQRVGEISHFLRFVVSYLIIRPLQAFRHLKQADLIYLHEYRLYPVVVLARLLGARGSLIYDAHDFYPNVYETKKLSNFWRGIFLPTLICMERWCLRGAAKTVVVSGGVATLYKLHANIDAEIVRNSHDPSLDIHQSQNLRSLLNLSEKDFVIVCVGNRKPGLAVAPLIDALAKVPENVHLVFIGQGHEWSDVYAGESNVSDRVHALGRIQSGAIVPTIKTADVAIVPYCSDTENARAILPNGLFQSIAAARPLIYAGLPDIKALIGEKRVGIEIDATNCQEVVSAIKKMHNGSSFRNECAQSTLRLSAEVSWVTEVDKLKVIVESVVHRQGSEHHDT